MDLMLPLPVPAARPARAMRPDEDRGCHGWRHLVELFDWVVQRAEDIDSMHQMAYADAIIADSN
jgi:hypothetical protein